MADRIVLWFAPAEDVTDLDEWFASLDNAVSLGRDGEWQADSSSVRVEVSLDHADEVVQEVRDAMGDSVRVRSIGEPLILDAEGRAIDE